MNSDSDQFPVIKKAVAIFASGNGSNAENCMRYFKDHPYIYINCIITNKADAGVIEKAGRYQIPCRIFLKEDWTHPEQIIGYLQDLHTDLIVLAGFLALVPESLISAFKRRIINMHPALLPKFGGKGMYGTRVHAAVAAEKASSTGITIHEVDEQYDHGAILFQQSIPVAENESPVSIEQRVRALELHYLPQVVEKLLLNRL